MAAEGRGTGPAEVLVVGAGPTGLTLALVLRRHGIPLRIIDRAAQPSAVSKALAVWSGSLEALQGLGVAEDFLAAGRRLQALTVGSGARRLAEMTVGAGIDSPYPFPLLLPQSRTERILTSRLEESGVTVERGVELAGLVQDDEGVTARLRHPDGRMEEARAGWLAGCDGARSAVRRALGIAFEGYTEPQTFLLVDALIEGGSLDQRSLYLWWRGGGTVALFPFERNVWRVFTARDTGTADAPATLEELQSQLDRHGPPGLRLREPSWLSTFRINERLAARYRAGRCFLAGDAAHIHSPAGGQGMNTGIQDAVNLGWKLAQIIRGIGDAGSLLDSYEAERRPVARDVVDASARRQHIAFTTNPAGRLLKDAAVLTLGNIPALQRKLQVLLSETNIAYRDGPLVRLGAPPRRPRRTEVGTRALDGRFRDPATGEERPLWSVLSGPNHCLLLFEDTPGAFPADDLLAGTGDRLRILRFDARSDPGGRLRRRYRLSGAGWVLVRPDQVIAARGGATDRSSLERYLDRVLRSAPGS